MLNINIKININVRNVTIFACKEWELGNREIGNRMITYQKQVHEFYLEENSRNVPLLQVRACPPRHLGWRGNH